PPHREWSKRAVTRNRFTIRLASAVFLSTCFLVAHPANAEIRYEVSLSHPEQHLFHVTVEVPDVKDSVDFQMAAWDALYEIRDFSSHVQRVTASANGREVPIEKLDKLTWRVQATGTVKVSYDTFWDDPGPFSSQVNSDHAFINPAMILLYVPGRRAEKSILSLHDVPTEWNVASGSPVLFESMGGVRLFTVKAATFDALADAPVEISHFEEFTIHDLTPPVHVVIHGDDYKKHDVESALRKIC